MHVNVTFEIESDEPVTKDDLADALNEFMLGVELLCDDDQVIVINSIYLT